MSEQISYEEMMKRLGEITARLETGRLPLEEAAKLYAEGMELSKQCHEVLEKASLEVQEIQVKHEGDAQ